MAKKTETAADIAQHEPNLIGEVFVFRAADRYAKTRHVHDGQLAAVTAKAPGPAETELYTVVFDNGSHETAADDELLFAFKPGVERVSRISSPNPESCKHLLGSPTSSVRRECGLPARYLIEFNDYEDDYYYDFFRCAEHARIFIDP